MEARKLKRIETAHTDAMRGRLRTVWIPVMDRADLGQL
jgi:hypothetical protein